MGGLTEQPDGTHGGGQQDEAPNTTAPVEQPLGEGQIQQHQVLDRTAPEMQLDLNPPVATELGSNLAVELPTYTKVSTLLADLGRYWWSPQHPRLVRPKFTEDNFPSFQLSTDCVWTKLSPPRCTTLLDFEPVDLPTPTMLDEPDAHRKRPSYPLSPLRFQYVKP